jgi:opacity protein-like surface antigen
MDIKLTVSVIAFVTTSSFASAQNAPDTRYYPATTVATSQPDPKDMKGMSQLTTAPAPAETHFYVAGYGGAQWSTSYGDNKQAINPAPEFGGKNTTTTTIHSNYGGVGGIKFGYMFDAQPLCDWMSLHWQPVVEADALYIGDNSHATDFAGPGSQEKFSSNSGDFFINGILRLPNSTIVTPYFGCGAGLQYLTTHGTFWGSNGGMVTGIDTSDLDFAAEALAGFDFRLCDHVSLFTEYKFIDALGTDAKSTNFPASNTYRLQPDQIQQHLITAGVKYDF